MIFSPSWFQLRHIIFINGWLVTPKSCLFPMILHSMTRFKQLGLIIDGIQAVYSIFQLRQPILSPISPSSYLRRMLLMDFASSSQLLYTNALQTNMCRWSCKTDLLDQTYSRMPTFDIIGVNLLLIDTTALISSPQKPWRRLAEDNIYSPSHIGSYYIFQPRH